MNRHCRNVAFGIFAAALTLTGACAKRSAKKPPTESPIPSSRAPEPGIRDSRFTAVPGLRAAPFGFDRHDLGREAREILKQNAETIKNNQGWEVLVEGHCDQRGTTEYNLALGQKRAAAVREYYLMLGISGDRVATISYGAEQPLCAEATEDCWARNRRGENKVKIGLGGGTADSKP